MHGAISGGCLDADLLEHARAVMKSGVPKIVDYLSKDDDTLFGVAMGCGGELRILVEPVDDALRAALRYARANDRHDLVAYVAEGPRPATRVASREQFATLDGVARWSRPVPASREVFLFGAGPEAAPFCSLAVGARMESDPLRSPCGTRRRAIPRRRADRGARSPSSWRRRTPPREPPPS